MSGHTRTKFPKKSAFKKKTNRIIGKEPALAMPEPKKKYAIQKSQAKGLKQQEGEVGIQREG